LIFKTKIQKLFERRQVMDALMRGDSPDKPSMNVFRAGKTGNHLGVGGRRESNTRKTCKTERVGTESVPIKEE
jgi:hypothetical protein